MIEKLKAFARGLIAWLAGLFKVRVRPVEIPSLGQLAKLEARFSNLALMARRGMAQGGGLLGWLIIFAVAAGFAIAFGLLFGVFNKITTDLNQTGIQVDQSFVSSIGTASSFASTGILIVLAIGVIGLAMILIRVIGGMGR